MKAILIDANERKVAAADAGAPNRSLDALRRLIGCEWVQPVMVGENLSFYLALQDSPSEPCGYEFAQWSIDDESVATLSAKEGNSVMLEIAGEGTAVVQAADEYGNTLSVVLNAQRPRELFTENITVFWRSSDGSIVDTDENRISCSPDEQIELFVGYIDTQDFQIY